MHIVYFMDELGIKNKKKDYSSFLVGSNSKALILGHSSKEIKEERMVREYAPI